MHGWNSIRLLIYTRILLFQSPESCPFVTEIQKCCRLPFVYNSRIYTACTADVPDKDPKEQWSLPWCFPETPEKDRSTKYRCLRNSKLIATFKYFTAKLYIFGLKTITYSTYNWRIRGTDTDTKKLVCPFFLLLFKVVFFAAFHIIALIACSRGCSHTGIDWLTIQFS